VVEARSEWVASGVSGHQISVEAFRADGSSLGSNELTFAAIQVVQNPIRQFPTVSQLVNGTLIPLSNSSPTRVMTPAGTPLPTQSAGSSQPQTTALPTNTPRGTGPTALVTVSSLNVRQGPGVSYPPVGYLAYGEQVQIVGRNTDSSWWAIPFEGGTAWILSEFTSVDGDTSQVPLAAPN
jgi:N-acetylmuramoyl-L-alanine amidase